MVSWAEDGCFHPHLHRIRLARHLRLPQLRHPRHGLVMGARLDLKLETVSREISALVREQVLEPLDKQGRQYRITRLVGLVVG